MPTFQFPANPARTDNPNALYLYRCTAPVSIVEAQDGAFRVTGDDIDASRCTWLAPEGKQIKRAGLMIEDVMGDAPIEIAVPAGTELNIEGVRSLTSTTPLGDVYVATSALKRCEYPISVSLASAESVDVSLRGEDRIVIGDAAGRVRASFAENSADARLTLGDRALRATGRRETTFHGGMYGDSPGLDRVVAPSASRFLKF